MEPPEEFALLGVSSSEVSLQMILTVYVTFVAFHYTFIFLGSVP